MTAALSRLSSLLVRDGLVSVKQMEQAFQRQVIYGGALDTILLEMDAVPEDRLCQYLSLATGLPTAEPAMLEYVDPRAVQICPPHVAEHFRVAPVSFDGSALRILVTEPVDMAQLETLATGLNTPVQPFVVPEYAFHLLLERLFGIPTHSRVAALGHKLRSSGNEIRANDNTPASELGLPKIIVEDEEVRRASEEASAISPRRTSQLTTDAYRESLAASEQKRTDADHFREEQTAPGRPSALAASSAGGVVVSRWRSGNTVEPSPIEPRQAAAALARADERDAVFATLVRAVRARTSYAAILTVQGQAAFGRIAIGGDDPDLSVAQVAVPLDVPSAFQNVVKSHAPYIGPVRSGSPTVDGPLESLGGIPPDALVIPVVIRDRVVALAYGHCGSAAVSIAAASELLPLASEAALALSRLILRAKAQAEMALSGPAEAARLVTGGEVGITGGSTLMPGTKTQALVDLVEAGSEPMASRAADEALTRLDELLPEVARRFPGKLWLDRYGNAGRSVRAAQHGPLLGLVVRLGHRVVPVVLDRMNATDRSVRYYATLCLGELRAPAAVPELVARLFDPDYGVRAAALDALVGYPPRDLDQALEPVRAALRSDPAHSRAAAHALGELRDVKAVPELLAGLDGERGTAQEAHHALVLICKQDFGAKAKKWRMWWDRNHHRSRIEWMLDGLSHSDDAVRLSASDELRRLTGEHFGYHYDLPRRDREEARLRWVTWWEQTGKHRFPTT